MKTRFPTKREVITTRFMVGDQEVIIDGYVEYYVEHNYGADADGKRGMKRIFIEDVTNVEAVDLDGNDFILNIDNLTRASEVLVTKFMEA